jgi:hypothetical protein
MITNDARCACETKSRIDMEKAAFSRKKTFLQETGVKFEEETNEVLHLEHRILWC